MPMTTQPDGLPYPVGSDTPDIPKDIRNLAVAVQDTFIKNEVLFGTGGPPGTLVPGQIYAQHVA